MGYTLTDRSPTSEQETARSIAISLPWALWSGQAAEQRTYSHLVLDRISARRSSVHDLDRILRYTDQAKEHHIRRSTQSESQLRESDREQEESRDESSNQRNLAQPDDAETGLPNTIERLEVFPRDQSAAVSI